MKTIVILEVEHRKPIPDLADKIAARAWTMDGVTNVTLPESSAGYVQRLREAFGRALSSFKALNCGPGTYCVLYYLPEQRAWESPVVHSRFANSEDEAREAVKRECADRGARVVWVVKSANVLDALSDYYNFRGTR